MLKEVRTLSAIWQSHNRAPCPYSTGPAVNNNVFVDGLVHIRALPQSPISEDKASNVESHLAAKETVLKRTEGALSGQDIRMMYVVSPEPSR
jgi:hypothetical protein